MEIKTQLFGTATYDEDDGADFEAREIVLNNTRSMCSVMIFEDLSTPAIKRAVELLDTIETLDQAAKAAILQAYDAKDDIVVGFIHYHFDSEMGLDENDEEYVERVYKKLGINQPDDLAFIKHLELGSITIYTDYEDEDEDDENDTTESNALNIVLDYNVIWEDEISFTDQVLAVTFDANKELLSINHES